MSGFRGNSRSCILWSCLTLSTVCSFKLFKLMVVLGTKESINSTDQNMSLLEHYKKYNSEYEIFLRWPITVSKYYTHWHSSWYMTVSGAEQKYLFWNQSKAKVKHDQVWSPNRKWMGDHYVLSFAPGLRFLWSQILCRLYKSPLDEAINRGPLCVYACKKITFTRWRSCTPIVHVRVQWTMETTE